MPATTSKILRLRGVALGASACAVLLGGCSNAKQGAVSGAGVGALSGLAIGSLTGNAGQGAAIGAVVGGVGGAVIGDRNRRERENAETMAAADRAAPEQVVVADRDRARLGDFAGGWTISGWSEVVASDRRNLTGTGDGSVEQDYFLRLDVDLLVDPATGQHQRGTLLFGSEPGRGVTLSSRFNDAPSTSRFVGSVASGGQVITLDEVDSIVPGVRRRVIIRFLSDSEFVVDVSNAAAAGSPRIGSFRFVRT